MVYLDGMHVATAVISFRTFCKNTRAISIGILMARTPGSQPVYVEEGYSVQHVLAARSHRSGSHTTIEDHPGLFPFRQLLHRAVCQSYVGQTAKAILYMQPSIEMYVALIERIRLL